MSEFDIKSALNRQADILEQKDTVEALRAENALLQVKLTAIINDHNDRILENARLLVRLEKAHSFISRADWMQFFEEEHAAERADLESNNG